MWLHVPAAGRALEFLLQPFNLAIVVGSLATLWLLLGSGTGARKGRDPSRASAASQRRS